MVLFIAFIAILSITFGIMALLMSSSRNQRVIAKRIVSILATGPQSSSDDAPLQQLLKSEQVNRFAWLNALIQKYHVSRMLKTRITQANVKTTPAIILVTSFGLALVGFVGVSLFVDLIALELAVAALLGYLPMGLLSFKRSRRINAFNAALPDAIDMMGRALRAGHSMTASINIVAEQSLEPVRSEFGEVFKQQNFGLPLRDAMTQMLDRVPSQDLRVLVTGMLVQKETGGNLAEILDRIANTIRERLKIHGEIKTHTAQGRMTGWILCLLPIVMLVVINMINPGYSNMLINTPIGKMLSYIGIALLITGGVIIRQIINGIEV
ncbi:MAG: type II secretion system F family protein [Acidobacteriaceae bacterium]